MNPPGNLPSSRDLRRAFEFALGDEAAAAAGQIGRYQLLEKIGEGGFGEVWLAEQHEPVRRRVAVKIIKTGMDTRELIARFEAERQALALMEHPNIARVFDAGATAGGRPYFVMEFVRGVPITQYCDAARLPTAKRLELFVTVCQAVQHAHGKGIIHRDLKPSNILITEPDGQPVAKIIDFGVAKAMNAVPLTEKTVFTRLHTFLGTPLYTSPEQIEAAGNVDTRSDIYSLGVLLYELLAGRPPFDRDEIVKAGVDAARRTILEVEPPRPSQRLNTLAQETRHDVARERGTDPTKLAVLLRGELDWIVMRCLEKDRARRYPTAMALADDVQRHLHDEPVAARPPSRVYQFQKLVRRNRLVFALGAAIAMTLLVGALAASWQAIRARQAEQSALRAAQLAEEARGKEAAARARAETERQRADRGELTAKRQAYAADMQSVQLAINWSDLEYARELVNQHIPAGAAAPDFRDWEWRYWRRELAPDVPETLANGIGLWRICVSPDGQWMAGIQRNERKPGAVLVWHLPSRRQCALQPAPVVSVSTRMAFAPRLPLLAVPTVKPGPAERRYWVQLWNVATGALDREWPLATSCSRVWFSADGEKLLTALRKEREIRFDIWRTRDGRPLEQIRFPPAPPAPANRPQIWFAVDDGWQRAAICSQELLQVFELPSGRPLWEGAGVYANAMTFSADGEILALAAFADSGMVGLWNAGNGAPLGELRGHNRVLWDDALVFWPDGRQIASAAADGSIKVWDVGSRALVRTLLGTQANIGSLALVPDGNTLVSSGRTGGEVALWDTTAPPAERGFVKLGTGFAAWCFGGTGSDIFTVDASGKVIRWHGKNWQERDVRMDIGVLPLGYDTRSLVAISADPPLVAVSHRDGQVTVWNWEQRQRLHRLAVSSQEALMAGFTADGSKVLLKCWNKEAADYVLSAWDVQTGNLSATVGPYGGPISVARSPDGRQLVASGTNRCAFLDPIHATEIDSKPWPAALPQVADRDDGTVSPDGRLLVLRTAQGQTTEMFDRQTLERLAVIRGPSNKVAFSPNGRRLAGTSAFDQSLVLYDASTTRRVVTLGTKEARISYPKFSPDGNVIGVMSLLAGDLYLWRGASLSEIEAADKDPEKSRRPSS